MKIIGSPEGEIGLEAELRASPGQQVVIRFVRPGTDQPVPGGMHFVMHPGQYFGDAQAACGDLNVRVERFIMPAFAQEGDQIATLEAENAELRARIAELEKERNQAAEALSEVRFVVQRREAGGEWQEVSATEPRIEQRTVKPR